jgi:hypothetical protein
MTQSKQTLRPTGGRAVRLRRCGASCRAPPARFQARLDAINNGAGRPYASTARHTSGSPWSRSRRPRASLAHRTGHLGDGRCTTRLCVSASDLGCGGAPHRSRRRPGAHWGGLTSRRRGTAPDDKPPHHDDPQWPRPALASPFVPLPSRRARDARCAWTAGCQLGGKSAGRACVMRWRIISALDFLKCLDKLSSVSRVGS